MLKVFLKTPTVYFIAMSRQAWECFCEFDEQTKYLFGVLGVSLSYGLARLTPGFSKVTSKTNEKEKTYGDQHSLQPTSFNQNIHIKYNI